ncbi:MAG: FecR domain-containing protein [Novosphingobium sp.]
MLVTVRAYDMDEPRRASEWLLAMQAAPDDADLRLRHAAWLAQDAAHATDWQEMCRTYELLGLTVPQSRGKWEDYAAHRKAAPTAIAAEQTPAPADDKIVPLGLSSRVRLRRSFATILTAALAASLLWLATPTILLHMQADHVTGTAAPQSITLADGSTVQLAPESAIAVDDSAGERRVRLLKGEAFFDVRHDPARPFRVQAQDIETTVLGTAFDVAMNDKGAAVAVKRGRVRVDNIAPHSSFSRSLSPGQWVQAERQGRAVDGRSPPELVAGWTQGQIVARDMSVADFVDAMRPWFKGIIILRGESLARQPLTGLYRLDQPVEALRAVADTQGATMRKITPWVIIISQH